MLLWKSRTGLMDTIALPLSKKIIYYQLLLVLAR
jgi:hypothetical protein